MMHARSYLYVPGDNPRFLAKVEESKADAIILDLEDSVKPENKVLAEEMIREFLNHTKHPRTMVRVEPSRLRHISDLVNHQKIDRIVLPKVDISDDLEVFNEINHSLKPIHALIESPLGLENLNHIASQENVVSLGIGEADFFAKISLTQKAHPNLLSYVRSKIVVVSAAFGLNPPIAPVSSNYKDSQKFAEETEDLLSWGYWGRACIHPSQVEIANQIFTISSEVRSRAEEIMKALIASKSGATVDSDGAMIDEAHIRWAARILEF